MVITFHVNDDDDDGDDANYDIKDDLKICIIIIPYNIINYNYVSLR